LRQTELYIVQPLFSHARRSARAHGSGEAAGSFSWAIEAE